MKMKNIKKAFTFVELIVVIMILWILSVIGFSSYSDSIADWRDTQRKSQLAEVIWAMKTYKQKKWSFPIPVEYFSVINWASNIVFWQGKLGKNISLSTIDEIPYDPKIKIPYLYSVTTNRQEFEIALSLENNDSDETIALVWWNYKSVSKNMLPTILVATSTSLDISTNKNLFIFDNQSHNLPYDFDWNEEPTSDWVLSFTDLLLEAEQNWVFSQNSSFETCSEIKKAGKFIWDWDYELRTNTWVLSSSWCTL